VTVDNTPPTVAVTAPAGGATVTGNVALTATATDNIAVGGVQFTVDGTNVGFEDTTSPYSVTWDSTSVPNASHTISAISRDTAGNTATAATVNVTVSNAAPAPPTGLVAAYGFNETTGTKLTDLSGKGNTGTTRNTTWTTAGKYGGAATFNGTTSWVTVNDANTLDLTTGMTLEAWLYPTALGTGWRTVIFKEKPGDVVYSLYANDSTQRALTQLNIGGELNAWSVTQLPLNTWTHIAGTWDGTTLRMWVNGALVGTRAVTGTLANSTGVLRMGGNGIWNEWFAGRIDEVRIYNRALTQAELQAWRRRSARPLRIRAAARIPSGASRVVETHLYALKHVKRGDAADVTSRRFAPHAIALRLVWGANRVLSNTHSEETGHEVQHVPCGRRGRDCGRSRTRPVRVRGQRDRSRPTCAAGGPGSARARRHRRRRA
jgi:hypothetical protein